MILELLYIMLLLLVFFEDIYNRKVTLILMFTVLFLGAYIHYSKVVCSIFKISILYNLFFIGILLCLLFLYSKIKMKKRLFDVIGEGDLLFFMVIATSFSITSFFILFSFSLIFSLILFLIVKPFLKNKTVPLAGFQSLFIVVLLLINLAYPFVDFYTL